MKVLEQNTLIGKSALVTYKDSQVQVNFDDKNLMFWRFEDNTNCQCGFESISYRKINNHLFSVSWKEESGLLVNQLIDLKNETLTAVWSNNNSKVTTQANFKFIV